MKTRSKQAARLGALHVLDDLLEGPLLVLAAIWLVLFVIELTRGLGPRLQQAMSLVWFVFVLDFALKLAIAPSKIGFLRRNVLTLASLLVPALRVFRFARVLGVLRSLRAARLLRLVQVFGSFNRSVRTLRATIARRRLQYVLLLTVAVAVIGAAGMRAFEPAGPDGEGFDGYLSALWWTMMVLTTMGSEYWPRTAEGRILCVALAVYAFAVFGYVTASIATLLVGRDADSNAAAGARERPVEEDVRALAREVAVLRAELSGGREDRARAAADEGPATPTP